MTRLPPIRPGIFVPLNTRAGSALAPIEPGARTLWEPWETGPRPKLWRLIVPWKPLPTEVAETFTLAPGSNCSTVSSLADLRLGRLVAELLQHRARAGASAFFRWPSSGLVSLRSSVSIAATWTAA